MTKKQKFDAVVSAYVKKHRKEDKKDIYVISDETPEEVRAALLDIQHDLGAGFDISYEIVSDAAGIIKDRLTIDNLDIDNVSDVDCASIYTSTQLSYIDNNNQHEIKDIIEEYGCEDIASAAAIWYNNKVFEAMNSLINYINN